MQLMNRAWDVSHFIQNISVVIHKQTNIIDTVIMTYENTDSCMQNYICIITFQKHIIMKIQIMLFTSTSSTRDVISGAWSDYPSEAHRVTPRDQGGLVLLSFIIFCPTCDSREALCFRICASVFASVHSFVRLSIPLKV